jgi:hypothetical protein
LFAILPRRRAAAMPNVLGLRHGRLQSSPHLSSTELNEPFRELSSSKSNLFWQSKSIGSLRGRDEIADCNSNA